MTREREHYCLRWERLDWGHDTSDYHCAECGTRVFFSPIFEGEDQLRLVCIECLLQEPTTTHTSHPDKQG